MDQQFIELFEADKAWTKVKKKWLPLDMEP
jgi:hypothetical protein